jgi:hypothetical protein
MTAALKLVAQGSEFVMRPHLKDRITVAEVQIEAILRKHDLQFAINAVTVEGRAVHQEIVLIERGT